MYKVWPPDLRHAFPREGKQAASWPAFAHSAFRKFEEGGERGKGGLFLITREEFCSPRPALQL
jgi:hypothetical protein